MTTFHKKAAALAATLLATGAWAQSSLTLFGAVDTNFQVLRGDGNGSIRRVGASGNAVSKLGVRGVEDLGGGLSASFWLEAGLNTDTGTGLGTNTNNQSSGAAVGVQGLTFNRRSTVGLAGTWGEIRLGRDYAPSYWNLGLFDPFSSIGSGAAINLQVSGGLGTSAQTALPTALRVSNSIGYLLPKDLGGLYGQVMYGLGENASNAAGGSSKDGNYAGFRLGYAQGPIDLAVAAGRTKYSAGSSVGGDYKVANIGGSYNFGIAKVMGQYFRDGIDTTPVARKQTGWLIGGIVPVGAGEFRVSFARANIANTANDGSLIAVGYVHHFSKRTAIYTTYGRIDNKGTGVAFNNGRAATTPGGTTSGLDIGLRHHF